MLQHQINVADDLPLPPPPPLPQLLPDMPHISSQEATNQVEPNMVSSGFEAVSVFSSEAGNTAMIDSFGREKGYVL